MNQHFCKTPVFSDVFLTSIYLHIHRRTSVQMRQMQCSFRASGYFEMPQKEPFRQEDLSVPGVQLQMSQPCQPQETHLYPREYVSFQGIYNFFYALTIKSLGSSDCKVSITAFLMSNFLICSCTQVLQREQSANRYPAAKFSIRKDVLMNLRDGI